MMMTMMPPPHSLHITDKERGVLVRPRSPDKDYKPSATKMTVLDIVKNKSDRFDNKNCSRKEANFKSKLLDCHLGPGSYDANFITKNSGFALLKTKIAQSHMPERNTTAAPPPGAYQVPRLMDLPDPSPVSLLSRQNSASFKSTGRSGLELSADAMSYQTLRNDLFMCHLGPGCYEIPQTFDATTSRPSTAASRPSTSAGRPSTSSGKNIEPLHHCEACDDKTSWQDTFKKSAGISNRIRPVTSFQIIQFDSGLPLGTARPSTSGGHSSSHQRGSTTNRVSKYTPGYSNNNNNNDKDSNNQSDNNNNISANNSNKGKKVRMKALPPSVLANMEDIQRVRNLPNYK